MTLIENYLQTTASTQREHSYNGSFLIHVKTMARCFVVADISLLGPTSHRMSTTMAIRALKNTRTRTSIPLPHLSRQTRSFRLSISSTTCYEMGENPPEEAPFPLTAVDRWVLSQTDEEFHKHDWEELKEIIRTNNLSVLKRKPSDLRRYMAWTAETKAEYGSMTNYLLVNRLPQEWGNPPFTPRSTVPFEDPSDYRILINDWPYGLEPDIRHIVVWLRTTIPTDSETGDMTPESRALVQSFIEKTFIDALGPNGESKVLWFKNWVALQSVRALEHIHVLVRNVDYDTLERWTGEGPKQKP